MPDTSTIRNLIQNNIVTNGNGEVSADEVKAALLGLCDAVDGIFTTFLKLGANTTSTSNGDAIYHTGRIVVGRTTDDNSGKVLQATGVSVDQSVVFPDMLAARRIVLYGNLNDNEFFGFGIADNAVRYQIPNPAASHVFFCGVTPTTSNELMRLMGTGLLGVGTTVPTARLHAQSPAGYQQLRLETPYTPSGSGDLNGSTGSICWNASFLYVKTAEGWKRSPLSNF